MRLRLRRAGVGRDREDEIILRILQSAIGRAPAADIRQPLEPARSPR
jgi:hypothetical protein